MGSMERHAELMRYFKEKRGLIERGEEWPEHPATVKLRDVRRIQENVESLIGWIMDEIKDLAGLDPEWAHLQEQVEALKEEELPSLTGKIGSLLTMAKTVFREEYYVCD